MIYSEAVTLIIHGKKTGPGSVQSTAQPLTH